MKPLTFIFQEEGNSTQNLIIAKEDLHIYIIESEALKESIKLLESLISARSRTRREYWLIDITALESVEKAEMMLGKLRMDIDDDIFLYLTGPNRLVQIWEMYKIKPDMDLIIRQLGTWTERIGMNMTSIDKWQRRGDLTVKF